MKLLNPPHITLLPRYFAAMTLLLSLLIVLNLKPTWVITLNDWQSGFNHPLQGWDHVLAMLCVGVWAAQLRGQALWLLPLAVLLGTTAYAEPTVGKVKYKAKPVSTAQMEAPLELAEMVVTGRADTQIGIAESASEGHIGRAQIPYHPTSRPSEILETVPGLIASQHSGDSTSGSL